MEGCGGRNVEITFQYQIHKNLKFCKCNVIYKLKTLCKNGKFKSRVWQYVSVTQYFRGNIKRITTLELNWSAYQQSQIQKQKEMPESGEDNLLYGHSNRKDTILNMFRCFNKERCSIVNYHIILSWQGKKAYR